MDPIIKPGSIAVVAPKETDGLKIGDIVAFKSPEDPDLTIIHTIHSIKSQDPLIFETKGDKNNAPDQWEVPAESIVGIHKCTMPYFGYVADYITKPKGFMLAVILPAVLFIIAQLINIKKGIDQEVERRISSKLEEKSEKEKIIKGGSDIKAMIIFVALISSLASTGFNEAIAFFLDQVPVTGMAISVKDFVPPEVPDLVSPKDEAILNTAGLLMDWETVEDYKNMNDPVYYIYQRAINEDFAPLAYESGELSDSEIPASGTPEGKYWWRVKACDAIDNCSDWSEVWTVTIDNTAPYVKVTNIEDKSGQDPEVFWDKVEIKADIIDENPHHYWLVIKDDTNATVAGPGEVGETNPLTDALLWTWDVSGGSGVGEGFYTIVLEAEDAADNKDPMDSVDKVEIEVRRHLDVEITSPATGDTFALENTIIIEWNLDKLDEGEKINAKVFVSMDGGTTFESTPVLDVVDINPQTKIDWTPTDPKYVGINVVVKVELTDGDGFEGSDESEVFTITP